MEGGRTVLRTSRQDKLSCSPCQPVSYGPTAPKPSKAALSLAGGVGWPSALNLMSQALLSSWGGPTRIQNLVVCVGNTASPGF